MRLPFFTSIPMRHLKPPDNAEDRFLPWPRSRVLLVVGLLAALLLVLVMWPLTAERRAVEQMEPQARALLFGETWRGFQTLCGEKADPALEPRCREQARFLRNFPECDQSCWQETSRLLDASR